MSLGFGLCCCGCEDGLPTEFSGTYDAHDPAEYDFRSTLPEGTYTIASGLLQIDGAGLISYLDRFVSPTSREREAIKVDVDLVDYTSTGVGFPGIRLTKKLGDGLQSVFAQLYIQTSPDSVKGVYFSGGNTGAQKVSDLVDPVGRQLSLLAAIVGPRRLRLACEDDGVRLIDQEFDTAVDIENWCGTSAAPLVFNGSFIFDNLFGVYGSEQEIFG